jgi:D-alanyl-D-alanine carboxypeptidase (penicillin-binding protein 5/6)
MVGRLVIVILAAIVALGAWNWFRPVPAVAASASLHSQETVQGPIPSLPWPKTGSAAVGASGPGLIASSGNEQPASAASVTKVMTALIVLTDKPITLDQPGPSVTITSADVQSYQTDLAANQSVVEVREGEKLTERELLEGLLIPSANNIADTLARWDAGTVEGFIASMNKKAVDLHLIHTTFADTSGASPSSVSTPSDLVALGMEAMKDQVFAHIVSMGETTLPVAGIVFNVDAALGQSGIIGIKTGSGLAEGANFLFAAAASVDGRPVTLYGCVMGQPTLAIAFAEARTLIASMVQGFHVRRVIAKNQAVASYLAPWGGQADLLSTADLDLIEWPGMILRQRLDARPLLINQPVNPGTPAGSEHVVLGAYSFDVPLVTGSPLYPPGRLWRLTRINFL